MELAWRRVSQELAWRSVAQEFAWGRVHKSWRGGALHKSWRGGALHAPAVYNAPSNKTVVRSGSMCMTTSFRTCKAAPVLLNYLLQLRLG